MVTSGGFVAWLESSGLRCNVNKVVHDVVGLHHGDRVGFPSGFKLSQLKVWFWGQRHLLIVRNHGRYVLQFVCFFFLQLYCPNGIFPIGNSGFLPRGKPAATESGYPTYGACWVF